MSSTIAYGIVSEKGYPAIITPDSAGTANNADALMSILTNHKDEIDKIIVDKGAVLFRGFHIDDDETFRKVSAAISANLMPYVDGNSPRTNLGEGLYTSTEFPADQFISLHSELSYSDKWPGRMLFGCITAAEEGGETPLCDNKILLDHLPAEIVDAFMEKQLCYIRNLHSGFGLGPSWQKTFETEDKATVEEFCRGTNNQINWNEDGSLTIKQYRPSVRSHSANNISYWFNQADQFHPSNFTDDIRMAFEALYGDDISKLPQYVTYGDGTEIPSAYFETIRNTVKELMVPVAWQVGDVVYLDNMRVMHGRMPYKGSRKVLLSMFN